MRVTVVVHGRGLGLRQCKGYATYAPRQTYRRVRNLPHAKGLVFKHVPRIAAMRKRLAQPDDVTLERALAELERSRTDEAFMFEQVLERWEELIETARPVSDAVSAKEAQQ